MSRTKYRKQEQMPLACVPFGSIYATAKWSCYLKCVGAAVTLHHLLDSSIQYASPYIIRDQSGWQKADTPVVVIGYANSVIKQMVPKDMKPVVIPHTLDVLYSNGRAYLYIKGEDAVDLVNWTLVPQHKIGPEVLLAGRMNPVLCEVRKNVSRQSRGAAKV